MTLVAKGKWMYYSYEILTNSKHLIIREGAKHLIIREEKYIILNKTRIRENKVTILIIRHSCDPLHSGGRKNNSKEFTRSRSNVKFMKFMSVLCASLIYLFLGLHLDDQLLSIKCQKEVIGNLTD